jgi:hypothetical protein
MAFDIDGRLRNVFKNTSPKNPLNALPLSDKRVLWALLTVHVSALQDTESDVRINSLDKVHKLAFQASSLAKEIQGEVFEGEVAVLLKPYVGKFNVLPVLLALFGQTLQAVLATATGERGHKAKLLANRALIEASELVRIRTGKYHDEHLAEVIQAVDPNNRLEQDLSGDSIRKKRDHMRRAYPLVYQRAVLRVRELCKPT